MKATFCIVAAVSVMFGIFSVVCGAEAMGQHPSYRYGQSRTESERAYERFERSRRKLHNIVRGVSIPFFLACLGVFGTSFFRSKGRRAWRVSASIGMAVALLMTGWSCILSGGVSFNEVFAAWIGASVLFAGLALAGVLQKPTFVNAGTP